MTCRGKPPGAGFQGLFPLLLAPTSSSKQEPVSLCAANFCSSICRPPPCWEPLEVPPLLITAAVTRSHPRLSFPLLRPSLCLDLASCLGEIRSFFYSLAAVDGFFLQAVRPSPFYGEVLAAGRLCDCASQYFFFFDCFFFSAKLFPIPFHRRSECPAYLGQFPCSAAFLRDLIFDLYPLRRDRAVLPEFPEAQ